MRFQKKEKKNRKFKTKYFETQRKNLMGGEIRGGRIFPPPPLRFTKDK